MVCAVSYRWRRHAIRRTTNLRTICLSWGYVNGKLSDALREPREYVKREGCRNGMTLGTLRGNVSHIVIANCLLQAASNIGYNRVTEQYSAVFFKMRHGIQEISGCLVSKCRAGYQHQSSGTRCYRVSTTGRGLHRQLNYDDNTFPLSYRSSYMKSKNVTDTVAGVIEGNAYHYVVDHMQCSPSP